MIFSITNPTELVDWLQIFCKSGWLSPWDPPLQWRKNPRKKLPPRNTPDSFCRLFHPTKSFACTAWALFFFFTNKILCSCANLRNSFLVVDCTTSKCYSCAWKKQDVVSALRPTFFIPNLESFISRLNEILRHDLTLSVGEPDNAAAKQGQELRSEQTVIPLHEQYHLYLFLRLNNSETFAESWFWAQR